VYETWKLQAGRGHSTSWWRGSAAPRLRFAFDNWSIVTMQRNDGYCVSLVSVPPGGHVLPSYRAIILFPSHPWLLRTFSFSRLPQNHESHPLRDETRPAEGCSKSAAAERNCLRAIMAGGGGPKSGSSTIMAAHQAQDSTAKLVALISFTGTNYCTSHIDRGRVVRCRPRFL
jgi:hypothetical protein